MFQENKKEFKIVGLLIPSMQKLTTADSIWCFTNSNETMRKILSHNECWQYCILKL